MQRWTRLQDAVLWEHGHEGAERCADIIRHRYGVARTPEAVKRHAYRIGAPMVRYEICPACGGKHPYLGRDGLCHACHNELKAEEQRRRNDELRAELRRAESAEERRRAERGYDAARAEATRLRRRLEAARRP